MSFEGREVCVFCFCFGISLLGPLGGCGIAVCAFFDGFFDGFLIVDLVYMYMLIIPCARSLCRLLTRVVLQVIC